MNLNVQFQVILVSYFYGFFFMIQFDIFNRLFYYKKGKFIRLLFEIIFYVFNALIYFILMLKTNNAIFNIFSLLFISFGIISYLILLQKYILKYLNYLFNKVAKKVLIIRLKLKVKYDKIIMERRKRKLEYEKNKRTKGSHKKEKQN